MGFTSSVGDRKHTKDQLEGEQEFYTKTLTWANSI